MKTIRQMQTALHSEILWYADKLEGLYANLEELPTESMQRAKLIQDIELLEHEKQEAIHIYHLLFN